jgi:hypothetical protein
MPREPCGAGMAPPLANSCVELLDGKPRALPLAKPMGSELDSSFHLNEVCNFLTLRQKEEGSHSKS